MAIPNDIRGVRVATASILVRAFTCLLGVGALAWGGSLLPLFWRQAPLNQVASELLEGHTFKMQSLADEARQIEATEQSSFCNSAGSHDAVVLRLAILNQAIAAKNRKLIDAAYNALLDSTRRALSCAPADSFAWLTLFWLDAAKRGLQPDNVDYLRLSYALAPNEGWIALPRNRLAMAVFKQLPSDLSSDAIDEFVRLVDAGSLYSETAAIFAGAAPAVQNRIVAQLKSANAVSREYFAIALYERGLDIEIPGVVKATRPWQ
jgi:hypothetical protein